VSTNPTAGPGDPGAGAGEAAGQPSEAELRAAYEAELSRITSADMMLQATVSLLNIGSRRLGPLGPPPDAPSVHPPERDLEQVRDAIDGVRALLPILERGAPQELRPLRDALSQLQMAYAREAQANDGADPTAERAQPGETGNPPPRSEEPGAPGPAQSSGRLWVPGS
jgi:hypothetical protein